MTHQDKLWCVRIGHRSSERLWLSHVHRHTAGHFQRDQRVIEDVPRLQFRPVQPIGIFLKRQRQRLEIGFDSSLLTRSAICRLPRVTTIKSELRLWVTCPDAPCVAHTSIRVIISESNPVRVRVFICELVAGDCTATLQFEQAARHFLGPVVHLVFGIAPLPLRRRSYRDITLLLIDGCSKQLAG